MQHANTVGVPFGWGKVMFRVRGDVARQCLTLCDAGLVRGAANRISFGLPSDFGPRCSEFGVNATRQSSVATSCANR